MFYKGKASKSNNPYRQKNHIIKVDNCQLETTKLTVKLFANYEKCHNFIFTAITAIFYHISIKYLYNLAIIKLLPNH